MDLLNTATINSKGKLELPAVVITKDSVGNIIHSAPLSSRIDADDSRSSGHLNEQYTSNNYMNTGCNSGNHKTSIMYDRYHGNIHNMDGLYDNLYSKNSDKYMYNPNNIHSTYMDKNRLVETDITRDWSKYNVNGDMNWGVHWPYPCDGYNGCRYPKADPSNAIFINFTKGITVVWGSADGEQRLAQYTTRGDSYVVIPPINTWLVDKNLNYFSGIIPPDQFDSLIMPFRYDNTLTKNILEQQKDMLIIPSIELLDGLRVVDYPPTSAMSYMQPAYLRAPDPLDGTGVTVYSQPHDVYEGMTTGGIVGASIGSIIGLLLLIALVYVIFMVDLFSCGENRLDVDWKGKYHETDLLYVDDDCKMTTWQKIKKLFE